MEEAAEAGVRVEVVMDEEGIEGCPAPDMTGVGPPKMEGECPAGVEGCAIAADSLAPVGLSPVLRIDYLTDAFVDCRAFQA